MNTNGESSFNITSLSEMDLDSLYCLLLKLRTYAAISEGNVHNFYDFLSENPDSVYLEMIDLGLYPKASIAVVPDLTFGQTCRMIINSYVTIRNKENMMSATVVDKQDNKNCFLAYRKTELEARLEVACRYYLRKYAGL